jgi:hypothetical protein
VIEDTRAVNPRVGHVDVTKYRVELIDSHVKKPRNLQPRTRPWPYPKHCQRCR